MKELSLTTDLMFNRILAKNNFKYEDEETAKKEVIKILNTDLIVVENKGKAIKLVNPDKSLEVQKSIVAEGYLFLKNERATYMKLVQYNAFGSMKFVYVVRNITL